VKPEYIHDAFLHDFISRAMAEDLGDGDHSSLATIPGQSKGKARLLCKEDGILAGVDLATHIFSAYDPGLAIHWHRADGDAITPGTVALEVEGKARSILSAERLVLNCLQRMSGIATYTQRLVKMVEPYKAQILDTRKTTPNMRLLEKWAVRIGGGTNHRIGLFDMIMLKDNHIDFAGGIAAAVSSAQRYLESTGRKLRIEVEARTLHDVEEVLACGGVDVIMLDNMQPHDMRLAVEQINGRLITEASGGITENNLEEVAATGVDFISIGAVTHSARSLDMSLKAHIE
jgi:nicotinate-nucleotide pyrophosphorylase (carboxylating)